MINPHLPVVTSQPPGSAGSPSSASSSVGSCEARSSASWSALRRGELRIWEVVKDRLVNVQYLHLSTLKKDVLEMRLVYIEPTYPNGLSNVPFWRFWTYLNITKTNICWRLYTQYIGGHSLMASTDLLSYAICVPNRPPFSPHIFFQTNRWHILLQPLDWTCMHHEVCCSKWSALYIRVELVMYIRAICHLYVWVVPLIFQYIFFCSHPGGWNSLYSKYAARIIFIYIYMLLLFQGAQRSDPFGKKTCAHGQLASHFDGGWFSDLVSAHHQMAFLEAPENTEQTYAMFAGGVFMPSACDLV